MIKLNKKLPNSPGVYFFKRGGEILYIGKATSLRDRVRSYFNSDVVNTRGPLIVQMVELATSIVFRKTDSVLEAVILEAELIKKFQPKYNVREKDDRSFNFVVITAEKFPRVLIERGRTLASSPGGTKGRATNIRIKKVYGPFPNGSELKEALKIIRKIFPFRDKCQPSFRQDLANRPCFSRQIGLCPGVCSGEISAIDYKKQIKNIELFFEGKKKRLISRLRAEMNKLAKMENFEAANVIKRQIFGLQHIADVSLIRREIITNPLAGRVENEKVFRIEAYDVAHHAGSGNVGVMTVVENGEAKKSEYKKFKIRGNYPADDLRSLREILQRRLNHPEWRFPDLLVVDGGKLQLGVAEMLLSQDKLPIPVVGVVKNEKHRPERIIGDQILIQKYESLILLANSEAHRFAIAFHRQKLSKIN